MGIRISARQQCGNDDTDNCKQQSAKGADCPLPMLSFLSSQCLGQFLAAGQLRAKGLDPFPELRAYHGSIVQQRNDIALFVLQPQRQSHTTTAAKSDVAVRALQPRPPREPGGKSALSQVQKSAAVKPVGNETQSHHDQTKYKDDAAPCFIFGRHGIVRKKDKRKQNGQKNT